MTTNNDYFVNHYRSLKFPFSLYHNPINNSLNQFLNCIASQKSDAEILVIGCGLMHELSLIKSPLKLTVVDIDERAIEEVKKLNHPVITDMQVINPDDTPLILQKKFDAIYAKEVIEHIVPWQNYLKDLKNALVSNGQVWLSTPNYGEPWLPLLENTILEMIARRSGYSRKNIHPSRFSMHSLSKGLEIAGFSDIAVNTISYRLALIATARNG